MHYIILNRKNKLSNCLIKNLYKKGIIVQNSIKGIRKKVKKGRKGKDEIATLRSSPYAKVYLPKLVLYCSVGWLRRVKLARQTTKDGMGSNV
jgi:hypothetical protein